MELIEFMEKFCPNYEKRVGEFFADNAKDGLTHSGVMFKVMLCLFSEAIPNFADRLCEKQREYCQEHLNKLDDCDISDICAGEALLYSKQPKI